MERIGKPEAKQIGDATRKVLEQVAEDLGLVVEVRGGRFDPSVGTYKPRIEFKLAGSAEKAFARDCEWIGLRAEDHGATFSTPTGTYRITGINLHARRYPVIAENVRNGKSYKFAASAVTHGLGRS